MGAVALNLAVVEDREAAVNLVLDEHPRRTIQHVAARWDWMFGQGGQGSLILARLNGEVIGQVGVLRAPLAMGGRDSDMAWIFDLLVCSEHRRMGLATQLLDAAVREFGPLAGATATAMSQSLFRKLGWQCIGTGTRYARVLAPMSWLLEKALKPRGQRQHTPTMVRLSDADATFASTTSGIEVRVVDRFNETADMLREEVSHRLAVFGRTSSQLNWRYIDRPDHDYKVLAAHRGGRMRGWIIFAAVTDGRHRRGNLVSSLWSPGDQAVGDALVGAAVDILTDARVSRINCVTLCRPLSETLLQRRFQEREEEAEVLVTPEVIDLASEKRWIADGYWEVSL